MSHVLFCDYVTCGTCYGCQHGLKTTTETETESQQYNGMTLFLVIKKRLLNDEITAQCNRDDLTSTGFRGKGSSNHTDFMVVS